MEDRVMKLGIDFGTSFSLPATSYLDNNLLLLPGGKYGIPSVFYYDDWEGVLVGENAEKAGQGAEAANLKREIKLELTSSFTADGRKFTAKEIVGYILDHVKDVALATAESKLINEPLEGVVISVPAAFGHNEKEIIREAAEIPHSQGGPELNVLGFIKEPVAAALAYFQASLADNTRILVYDLGGGTCDVAIVEADSSFREKYKVIDSDMIRIGGKDWDAKIEEYIIRELENQCEIVIGDNPGYREKIKREAISVKHAFSDKIGDNYREKVRARIEVNGRTYSIPLTKILFDELTRDLLNETIEMTKSLMERNCDSSINEIICVGGSSNMPQVQEGLRNAFPASNIQVYEPEKAIAIGASIYTQYCDGKDTFLSDIASFSYGTRCYRDYDNDPDDYIIVNLVKKGNRLPSTKKHRFYTVRDGQQYIRFKIFESSNTMDEYDFQPWYKPIMTVALELLPDMPKGTSALLHMTLTADGIIEVIADDEKGHTIKVQKQLIY